MNLEKNEFMLIVDSTNGFALLDEESDAVKTKGITVKEQVMLNVEDSIKIDRLAEKWGIAPDALIAKMQAASEEEFKTLWENINDFWERNDRESHS